MNEQVASNTRLSQLRELFEERRIGCRPVHRNWTTAHTEELFRIAEALQRERDMSATVAGRALTELHEKVTTDQSARSLAERHPNSNGTNAGSNPAGRSTHEPPAVRRWDIRPAFADGVDFLVDPAGEWVKWEDVAPHLRASQPPGDVIRSRAFWSDGHKDLLTAYVSADDITLMDDNGHIYEPAGDEMRHGPTSTKGVNADG